VFPEHCIASVEDAFRGLALGEAPSSGILGMHAVYGSWPA